MRSISTLKNIVRPILLAGLMCGMAGVVHAQLGGPGQVGGMGQQGAPAGEFPGQGSAIDQFPPPQGGVTTVEPGGPAPQQNIPDKKTSPKKKDASKTPNPADQAPTTEPADAAKKPIPPLGPDVPGQSPGAGAY